jgi:hypothetical protein
MTVAERLGRAMAAAAQATQGVTPATQATQGVTPAEPHARHEMTPVARHATLEAAAVQATLKAKIGAAGEPAAVAPESHRQREVHTA